MLLSFNRYFYLITSNSYLINSNIYNNILNAKDIISYKYFNL